MDRGELVPDDVVIAIAKEKLASVGDEGFILDGFPRTTSAGRGARRGARRTLESRWRLWLASRLMKMSS